MKLLIIQLSDMHFENTDQTNSINIDKMVNALKSRSSADKCIIIASGDIANKGKAYEYDCANEFIRVLVCSLKRNGYRNKNIPVLSVPGNHDIDFSSLNVNINSIVKAYEDGTVEELKNCYIESMQEYFKYAAGQGCFTDDKVVFRRIEQYGNKKVGFVLYNSAPFSLLGGNAEDMGNHYLSDHELQRIEDAADADINILVLHHSIEWLKTSYKDRLRKIIARKYSLVLSGHEHTPVGQSSSINNSGMVQFVQGNALYGYAEEGNGFCAFTVDLDRCNIEGYSYIWHDSIYVPENIFNTKIQTGLSRDIILQDDFRDQIIFDLNKRIIDDYYVFPGLTFNMLDKKETVQRIDINEEQKFFEFLKDRSCTIITGDHKSGKTIIAKRLFKYLYDKGKSPLYIEASSINKKRIEKTIHYVFQEEYCMDDFAYEKYKQLDESQKVAIIDEANILPSKTLETLVCFLKQQIGQIIIFSENSIDLNIRKQVVETFVDKNVLTMNIKPFLYDKRKMLISNILRCSGNDYDIEMETAKINDLINIQVKYFNLDPEFIISFVTQYEKENSFRFTAGMNVFNVVYENSIKNQIIMNSDAIDPTDVINVLRELAYKMHFEKRSSIKINEINQVTETYRNDYRQEVNIKVFLDTVINAKILVENDNEYRFKDHTIIAYFVAQAIIQKYNQDEDIKDNIELLLRDLCFSINSDIVLFLALITNNPKFVNYIIEGAQRHFDNQEELSFDKKNVKYILDTNLSIKNTIPDKDERERRESELAKQEEKVKFGDLVELVNEYDYTEDDLKKIENQIMISFKYLEILSKALPAFCQYMKVEQQDRLVNLIYRCPNQFLFALLKDISENFDAYTNDLYNEIVTQRKEKNNTEISLQSVQWVIRQISSVLVIALYQLVAMFCTNERSILALNEFDFENNTNYALQNLIMAARNDDIKSFSKKAKTLDKHVDDKLSRSIIKSTVRDYFLRNSGIEIYGEAQSLIDYFFDSSEKKRIKTNMVKKRIIDREHK